MTTTPTRLHDTGPIHVTDRAAAEAGRAWRCQPAEARRRLVAIASQATAVDVQVSPERWRARSYSTGWDVGLAVTREVVREGTAEIPLAVVVGATVRTRTR